MSKDQKNASFEYSVSLLRMLLKMQLITETEYNKIVKISTRHYEAKHIYV